ncbi:hypothetical protein OS493_038125 [Desmophyllum pertusum]|uniref:Death domain-containing protein n=1 Tax=Desmophyllum pertusum TaxID=174260 RepID=A0A9W9Z6R6_9CNID|nr:hypothetical protein OS493_038125 [Desmophyllum pertusum]
MPILDWGKNIFNVAGAIEYLSSLISRQPQQAVFFGYFPAEESHDSEDILYLICCPSHLRDQIVADVERRKIKSTSESDSKVDMLPGHDKAYVSLSGGIRAVYEDEMDDFYLRFKCNDRDLQQVLVRVTSDKERPRVIFYNSPEEEDRHLLGRLNFEPRSSPLKRDCKKPPLEFFGVPISDQTLLEADPNLVLGIGKRFVDSETYDDHHNRLSSGNKTSILRSFFEVLAGLESELQDECFEALVKELRESSEEGTAHVVARLRQGRDAVCIPARTRNDVLHIVSEKVRHCWKKLARELNITEENIDRISEDENNDGLECCHKALQTWRQENGEEATIRKLMIALNKAGFADVNSDVIKCLSLV